MNHLNTIGLTVLFMALAQFSLRAQGSIKPAVKSNLTQTDMSLLVNAGTLGSQPTQGNWTAPVGANTPQTGNVAGSVVGVTNQPGYVATKPGKYGIAFDAGIVQQLYKKRIMDNLDNFIEAASINLNPNNNTEIVDQIIYAIIESAKYWGSTQGMYSDETYKGHNIYKDNTPFVMHMHNQLDKLNLKSTIEGNNPIGVLAPLINYAAGQAGASYGDTFLIFYALENNSTKAAASAALKLAYLFSIDNVAKQNDPTYKVLYDNYIARSQGKKSGTYQFASDRHGIPVSFTRYGLQFGAIAPFMVLSKSAQATTYLWDDTCDCPDSDLFNVWSSSSTKSSFIIP